MTESLDERQRKGALGKGVLAITPALTAMTPVTAFAADNTGGIGKDDQVTISNGAATPGGQLKNDDNATDTFNNIIGKVKIWVLAIFGLAMLWMLGNFIWHFTALAATSANPKNRPEHIKALGFDFVCTAGLGSLAWIAGMAYAGLR